VGTDRDRRDDGMKKDSDKDRDRRKDSDKDKRGGEREGQG
jgi:hypothetical protein